MGRPSSSTAVRDGTIAETATARASGRPRPARGPCSGPVAPRFVGVVLEAVRVRYPQLVRNPGPGHHPAVLVGGHGFDRGGADVDADCHLFA